MPSPSQGSAPKAVIEMRLPKEDILPPMESLLPDELTKAEAALNDSELSPKLSLEELELLESELRKTELGSLHESVKSRFNSALKKISELKLQRTKQEKPVVAPTTPVQPSSPTTVPETEKTTSIGNDHLLQESFSPHNFLSSAIQNCNLEQIEAMLNATKRSLAYLSFDDPDYPVLNANIFALETQKIQCESGVSPLAQRQN